MGLSVFKRLFLKVLLFGTTFTAVLKIFTTNKETFPFWNFQHDNGQWMDQMSGAEIETISRQSCDIGVEKYLAFGKQRLQKSFLTIGISSVHRSKGSYLIQTLKYLIEKSTQKEQENVTVVLFLADFNSTFREEMYAHIVSLFSQQLGSGFLQVIQAPSASYPQLTNLRRTFGDEDSRVTWRSKQAIDVAFLLDYCRGMSEYFMILEDDVNCSSSYIAKIRSHIISKENQKWLTISFTKFLIIGMLFRSEHLERLPRFLLMFYAEQPVDYLVLKYFDMLVPEKNDMQKSETALFQHLGLFSTLPNKEQHLIDHTFRG